MPNQVGTSQVIRFATFEVDLHAQELRKGGLRLKLSGQPFQVLAILLEQPGTVVTREELQKRLWPNTFVDVDHNLNTAINKIREALGDSSENPRFVETLPRRGYRFIGKVDVPRKLNGGTNGRRAWMKIASWTVVSAACVLVAAFVYHRTWDSKQVEQEFKPVPFTAYAGREVCPTFSPDGSQIAFAWDGDPESGLKGFDVYVKLVNRENLLRLTHKPSGFVCPAWSPDGTQIAFHRISGADTGLYVIPALGGSERKLHPTRIPFEVSAPISWSPDGKWIAYKDFLPPDSPRVLLLSLETLESRQIPHEESCWAETQPAFSHSGKQLAYICGLKENDNELGIYSVSLSGGPPTLVTRFMTGWGWPNGIAWTANDKKLILARPITGNDFELDEVAVADGSLKKLPFGRDGLTPAISVRGDKLAFTVSAPPHIDIWRKDLTHPEAAATKLISSTRNQAFPQYSPDGKHIAFASNRGGTWEIWMSDSDGTHLVRMSDAKSSEAGVPRWSPDSQRIAFDSRQSGKPSVYIVDISERLPRKLVTNLSDMSTPSWSPDGKWIYFRSSAAHSNIVRIFRCPESGGDAVALSSESCFWESHDGKVLYCRETVDKKLVYEIQLEAPGKEPVLIKMAVRFDPSQWTVVPGGIYFVPEDKPESVRSFAYATRIDAPTSVRYFDFATKQVRQVFESEKALNQGLSVSPDGRWILYTQEGEDDSDIMLVDYFD